MEYIYIILSTSKPNNLTLPEHNAIELVAAFKTYPEAEFFRDKLIKISLPAWISKVEIRQYSDKDIKKWRKQNV